jgi:hypothetical protein
MHVLTPLLFLQYADAVGPKVLENVSPELPQFLRRFAALIIA